MGHGLIINGTLFALQAKRRAGSVLISALSAHPLVFRLPGSTWRRVNASMMGGLKSPTMNRQDRQTRNAIKRNPSPNETRPHGTVKLTESRWPSVSRFAAREETDWAGLGQIHGRGGRHRPRHPSTAA